jgi:AcrR family transcriptional regulator
MEQGRTGAPRGRRREADLNDARLMQAALEVFAEQGWEAPVSEIARRAGVGMGSLYRRYPSKELLAQRMRIRWMEGLADQARAATAEEPDPWAAFARFLRDVVSSSRCAGPLLPLVGGRLPATDEVHAAAQHMRAAFDELVSRAHRAGVLRADFTSADIPLLLEHLTARIPATSERAAALHQRYLALILAGLRVNTAGQAADADAPLPGPAPDWAELRALWNAAAE